MPMTRPCSNSIPPTPPQYLKTPTSQQNDRHLIKLLLISSRQPRRMRISPCILSHIKMAYAGGGGVWGFEPPPRTGKNCCRKMMLFPKFLFLATNFQQNRYKFNFSIEFSIKKFQNFLKISPTNCVFRPNARKFNAWFCNFFAKQAKIQKFLHFSSGIFCKFSKNFPNQLCFSSKRAKN